MAGAEREVIGFGTNGMGRMNQNNAKAGYRPNPYSDGIDGVPITTPSTDAAKQWAGWGSALKPAHEPVVLARKPLEESTIAANVLKWSTGAINIDACRIAGQEPHHNYGRTSGKGAFCGRSEEPSQQPDS
jgi:site-specific DNA-methyltransferase (adenine-specific)